MKNMEKTNRFISWRAIITLLLLLPLSAMAAGLPNVTVDILRNKIHHAGVAVMLDFIFTNNSNKPIEIYLDANPFENHKNVIADGEIYSLDGLGDNRFTIPAGESVKQTLGVDNLPYNTKVLDSIKLQGRSSVTSQNNPYGEFSYTFKDIEIPPFPNSNRPNCYFLDNEFDLTVDKVIPNGKDLEVVFTLTNNGKRNKRISSNELGRATDDEGDQYDVQDSNRYKMTDIPSGESIKGKVTVNDGAKRNLKKIRIMYTVHEVGGIGLYYPVLLQLDNVSAQQ